MRPFPLGSPGAWCLVPGAWCWMLGTYVSGWASLPSLPPSDLLPSSTIQTMLMLKRTRDSGPHFFALPACALSFALCQLQWPRNPFPSLLVSNFHHKLYFHSSFHFRTIPLCNNHDPWMHITFMVYAYWALPCEDLYIK
ncbi:hypothetical protein M758_4G061200 [Ceratodon purpureus]|nr:hypothetical protein M758_4G061200 [Ceratodon purpureus]